MTCDQPQQRHKRTHFCTTRCLLFYSFLQIGNLISSTFFLAYQKVGRCHAGTGSNEKRLTGVRARFQRCISSSGFVIATTIALLVPSGATSSNTAVLLSTSGTASFTALARRRSNRIFRHGNARTTLQDSKHVGRFSSGWCD